MGGFSDAAIEARRLWESHDLDGYWYAAQISSTWHRPGRWHVLVSGDAKLLMPSPRVGDPVANGSDSGLFDIEELFAFLERAQPDSVEVSFSREWGLPTRVVHDAPNSVDEEFALTLTLLAPEAPEPSEVMAQVIPNVDAIFEGTVVGVIGDDYVLVIEIGTVYFERPVSEPGLFDGSIGIIDLREPDPFGSAADWVGREIIVLGTHDNDVAHLSKKNRVDSLWLVRAAAVRTDEGLRTLEDRFFTLDRRELCPGGSIQDTQPDAEADLRLVVEWANQLTGSPSDDPLADACETLVNQ